MKVSLAYGQGEIEVELPDNTTVLRPRPQAGLPDERAALLTALDAPIGCEPLRAWLKPAAKICIIFPDITRAMPNIRVLTWLLEYLHGHGVTDGQIVLLNSTGTHRPNTPAELDVMLGTAITRRYRVENHYCERYDEMDQFGTTRTGAPALINRHAARADVRILTGFIEPHFFAGFSGGPKALMPGVAGLKTIISNHGAANIGSPKATFGINEGNPIWDEMMEICQRVGRSFLLNVSLNEQKHITGWFAGDLVLAHRQGREFVRQSAMTRVDAPFDIVVTTNSGYPLDMNLYQGVKGMSAGAVIVKPGGTIILAAECREGMPLGSPCDNLLRSVQSPAELLAKIASPGFEWPEQWQAHIQTLIQSRARVLLHSDMSDELVRAALLEPCADIAAAVRAEVTRIGPNARVAVLPWGPLTIPYIAA
ncbi:MAG: nickel-dependent lactate racemase [Opitutaceae bacterium]|nr:nickel-dependent lactate racemase [Opitutaceae bacterium]MBP9913313.1 nickel-dependent lactate racemase [Opitutaceae bacterium]